MKARSSEITISLCFDMNNMFYISLKTGFFFLFFSNWKIFFLRIKKQVLPLVQIFRILSGHKGIIKIVTMHL